MSEESRDGSPTPPMPEIEGGVLRFLYQGGSHLLGYSTRVEVAGFHVFDRPPTVSLLAFPLTAEGWTEAWAAFTGMEPEIQPYSGTDDPGPILAAKDAAVRTVTGGAAGHPPGSGAATFLQACAALTLFGFLIAALVVFAHATPCTGCEVDGALIGIGIVLIAAGIVVCALLYGLGLTLEYVISIRIAVDRLNGILDGPEKP
jgi:hypothetical protein